MSDLNQDNLIVTTVSATNASPFDEIRGHRTDGSEYWTAREIMKWLGYTTWRKGEIALQRAIKSMQNQGYVTSQHVAQVDKVAHREGAGSLVIVDYEVSRFMCYIIAMNADPDKEMVALAQGYFANKTREAELSIEPVAINLSNRDLALMVIAEADRADALVAQIEQDKPCTDLGKAIIKSDTNITVGSFAKMLGTGQNRYFAELRECHIIMLNSTLPYQIFIDRNVFVVTQTINNNVSYPVSLITPSGQAYLVKRHLQYIQSGITEDSMESVLPSIV